MSVSYVSSLTDVPGIQTAISHLQDLQHNMRNASGFQNEDTSHIDVIIQCIQELERERTKAHELLETETIKASVLRHKLQYYPGQIKNEINEAVGAARRDNEEELASLNKELKEINDDIAYSSAKLKEIDDSNAILHPERDRVKQENEECIAQLNERMSEKAVKQIILNDTRDKLRDTNQRIVELEEGLIILKEDLIQERNDHRIEKNRIKNLTTDASDKTRDQKHTNSVRKLELTNLREKLGQMTADFTSLRDDTLRLESSIQAKNREEDRLTTQLHEQINANEKLRAKGVELDAHGKKMDRDFEQRKAAALNKIEKLNLDIDNEKERGELLESNKKEAEEQYQSANEVRKAYEAKVAELKEQLQRAQDTYKARVEDNGRLTQENQDMEMRLIELAEEHELLVRNLNKELQDERDKLAIKRKERMELQAERETSQKELTDFRGEQQKYLREMNKKISEKRNQHDKLTEEGRDLRRIIKQNDKDTEQLTEDLQNARNDFDYMKDSLEFMIDKLETSIAQLESQEAEKRRALAEKTPIFEELEKNHNETAEKYDTVKKSIISLKNKKSGLEDSTQRMQRDIDKLDIPRKATESDLKRERENAITQLNERADERNATERELYRVGAKLKTTLEENDRFRTAVKKLDAYKEHLLGDLETTARKKDRVLRALEEEKDELMSAWYNDQDMTQATAERDQEIVDQFTELLGRTEERQQLIATVSSDLTEELGKLDGFLKTVSTKRPKEVRKDIKKMEKDFSRDVTRPSSQTSVRSMASAAPSQTSIATSQTRDQSRMTTPAGPRTVSRPPSFAPRSDTIADKF